jgi:hypothetical protein
MAASSDLATCLESLGYAGHTGLARADDQRVQGAREYIWRDLRDKVGLDAAFFQDGVPIVGFTGTTHASDLSSLRQRLWNYGRVPLLMSVAADATATYNALTLRGSDVLSRASREEQLSEGLLAAFSRQDVEAGAWARTHANAFRSANRVDSVLLNNLRFLRSRVPPKARARREAVDSFIGGALLASYLADRGILDESHLDSMVGMSSLQAILAVGKSATARLFAQLAEHFNGDVFGPIPEAVATLEDGDIASVASLLRGDDLPSGQQALWPYDFSVLPADLVSTIYEQLLESSRSVDAAFYTPRFLVDLILDEVLPWDEAEPVRVADLSCGSGAFLTESFRRLAYRAAAGSHEPLTYNHLQDLMLTNIFGVDSNPAAARVVVFSLYLALLEELDPPTIWTDVVLPGLLDTNIVVADAFDEHAMSTRKFDVVVGNPPWMSKLSAPAKRFVEQSNRPIADQQIAEAFLWLAVKHIEESGTFALAMPAKPLLHNRSPGAREFRKAVFADLRVKTIVDLSALRRQVFEAATAPCAVIVASLPSPQRDDLSTDDVLYVAPHPRPMNLAVDALVVTPEEIRTVSAKLAAGRPDLWKVLLWGSGRDLELLDRMRVQHPTVREIAGSHGWTYGQGFQVGGGDENSAAELRGLPVLTSGSIGRLRLAIHPTLPFERLTLHRTRSRDLYRAPVVVAKRTFVGGRPAAVLLKEDVVFNNGMLGVAGPSRDEALLSAFAAITVSSVGQYWHFLTSASWGVERDFVELNEHLGLPLPTPDRKTTRRLAKLADGDGPIDDGELDGIVFDLYDLSLTDRTRIREVVTGTIDRFRVGQTTSVDSTQIARYCDTIADALSRTVPNIGVTAAAFRQGSYQAVTITFADPADAADGPSSPSANINLDVIVEARSRLVARTTGVIAQSAGFFVNEESFYIVKTLDVDRWSFDAALDDAERMISVMLSDA